MNGLRIASTAAAALLIAAGIFTGALAFAEATQDTPGEASVDTAGGASKDNSEDGHAEPFDLDAFLAEGAQTGEYAELVRCIQASRIRDIVVLDDQHVAFRLSRGEQYLVQFPHRCPGLHRNEPVAYETRGQRLCAQDWIRGMGGFGSYGPGMRCNLNTFQPVSAEQLELLKDTLRRRRR